MYRQYKLLYHTIQHCLLTSVTVWQLNEVYYWQTLNVLCCLLSQFSTETVAQQQLNSHISKLAAYARVTYYKVIHTIIAYLTWPTSNFNIFIP